MNNNEIPLSYLIVALVLCAFLVIPILILFCTVFLPNTVPSMVELSKLTSHPTLYMITFYFLCVVSVGAGIFALMTTGIMIKRYIRRKR